MKDYINYMIDIGVDNIPHRESNLLAHSISVSEMLQSYNRPIEEQVAGLFHSIYGTEYQMYGTKITREEIQSIIGKESEHIVNLFCTLEDRVNTILYGKGLKEPYKTTLRWVEYCNIKDQDPTAQILKEFEILLTVNPN